MKVEIDTAALADAVAWTSRVIDARPSNPILAGVKLEAIDGTLQFSAFNYEISARHHIEAGVDEAGSVLVQGKLLADITKSLRSEKTYLVTDGSTLTRPASRSSPCSSCPTPSTRICPWYRPCSAKSMPRLSFRP